MKYLKITSLLVFLLFAASNASYACHDVTITETNAVDNGNGTFTYDLEICLGAIEDTWGFELELTYAGGTGNIVGNTNCITSSNTGETICASLPSTSGSGDIEYGDFDGTGGAVYSDGSTNECATISITVDSDFLCNC